MINIFTQKKVSTCISAIDKISENTKTLETESFKLLDDTGSANELSCALHLRIKCLRKDLGIIEHIITNDVVRYTVSEMNSQHKTLTSNMLQKLIKTFRRKEA